MLPKQSDHTFSQNAPGFEKYLHHPLLGWVSGVDLSNPEDTPQVFLGSEQTGSKGDAVVMHCRVDGVKRPRVDIVNVFSADETTNAIRFTRTEFSASKAIINGEERSLAA